MRQELKEKIEKRKSKDRCVTEKLRDTSKDFQVSTSQRLKVSQNSVLESNHKLAWQVRVDLAEAESDLIYKKLTEVSDLSQIEDRILQRMRDHQPAKMMLNETLISLKH